MKNLQQRVKAKALMVMIVCVMFMPAHAVHADDSTNLNRLLEVYSILESEHLSGTPSADLVDAAIYGMLWQLQDPYTDYFTAEEWERYVNEIEQSYAGIGIRIAMDAHGIYVDEVFPNTPAEGAGIQRRDYIVEVAGQAVSGWTLDEVSNAVRGPEGTKVELNIQRGEETMHVELERSIFSLSPVSTAWFGDGIGYLQLSTFSIDAYKQFDSELGELEKKELQMLILDLRDNGGGYLHTAQQIAGRLLGERTFMYEVDRYGAVNVVSTISSRAEAVPYSIVLLVNGFSASASELLAGALQDYEAALLIGEQTYGKGSVQQIYSLSDGSVLKVTVEKYLTPQIREVNDVGIEPDRHVIGRLPQLIAALRASGVKEIRLEEENHRLKINDVFFSESVDYVVQDEQIFVASRILGALSDSVVGWNGKERSVEFSKGSQLISVPVTSPEVLQAEGKTYIELSHFKRLYPKLHWSWDGQALKIRY